MVKRHTIVMLILLFLAPSVRASDPPSIVSMVPGEVNLTHSENVTFSCGATDDVNLFSISLYNDLGGDFSLNQTRRILEFDNDSETLLLCHFNDYVCEGGETAEHSSTDIVQGKFMSGVRVNDSDTLRFSTAGNLNYTYGTIEFWAKIGMDPSSSNYWFVSTGDEGIDEIHIYVDWGYLYFEYFDTNSLATSALVDISSWNVGEWHHIAGIWDLANGLGSDAVTDLFVDGSNSSTFFESNNFRYPGTMKDYLYIGSLADGSSQGDSIIDELRISDVPRTAAEINDSYNRGVESHLSESANWTVAGIPDGSYSWNCLAYDNESQPAWGATNHTLYVDTVTPPYVSSISLSPSSDDGIDPGVTINVTAEITDLSNISSAVLQYNYDVDWINVTMQSMGSDLWNASFTTIGSERIYQYRIWANDTIGNHNTTQTYSVNSTLDYSWSVAPSPISAYGFVDTVDNVGTLAINNTGDDTLIISLSDDWPILDVYYNTTEHFTVPSGSTAYVNVTARFAAFDSARNMTIGISAEPSAPGKTASPESSSVSVVMNSYSGGAYLNMDITSFPITVYQGETVNLTATISNIGNETAEDVWFNWTLPYGWVNSSGSERVFIGNISPQSNTNTGTISVTLNASASSGISVICINASASGGTNNSDCENVAVLCSNSDGYCGQGCTYLNDEDCEAPSTGNGGTSVTTVMGGGTAKTEYGLAIDVPTRLDLDRGENATLNATIHYGLSFTSDDVSIDVSGYPLTYVSVSPGDFDGVNDQDNISFEISILAPPYITPGQYDMKITLSGRGKTLNNTLTGSADVIVFVHSVGNESAIFDKARQAFDDMESAGFYTGDISDVNEMLDSFIENWDFESAKSLAESVISVSGLAFRVSGMLSELESDIGEAKKYSLSVPETEKLYSLAASSFQRGDYEQANERAGNALLSFSVETGTVLWILSGLFNHSLLIAVILIASGFSFMVTREWITIKEIARKMKRLDLEEKVTQGMIMRVQKQYFKDKPDISMRAYSNALEEYESMIAEIKRTRAHLRSLSSRKGGMIGSLRNERKNLIGFIKDSQLSYFSKENISKSVYKKTMSKMRDELAGIEKSIDMAMNRKGRRPD